MVGLVLVAKTCSDERRRGFFVVVTWLTRTDHFADSMNSFIWLPRYEVTNPHSRRMTQWHHIQAVNNPSADPPEEAQEDD
jgi:hypothetical protein